MDEKSNTAVANGITGWTDNGDWAYFVDYYGGLILLDCKSESLQKYGDISSVPEAHKGPFVELLQKATVAPATQRTTFPQS
jgi:hypothetical protein